MMSENIAKWDNRITKAIRWGSISASFLIIFLFSILLIYGTADIERKQLEEDAGWLALNIYHEARDQSEEGRRAVTAVVFNRIRDERWPDTIKSVVTDTEKSSCSFSWFCDQVSDEPKDGKLFEDILFGAKKYIYENKNGTFCDPTSGAHSYHTTALGFDPNPYFRKLTRTKVIGDHFFYGDQNVAFVSCFHINDISDTNAHNDKNF